MNAWYRRFAVGEGERGAVLLVVAVAMVVMIGATALAVDVGQLTNSNRTLQAAADVIALDAARALNGETAAALSGSSGAVTVAVQESALRNNVAFSQLTVELGTTIGSVFSPIATSVLNGAVQTVTSAGIPTAVRISAARTVDFAFAPGGRQTSRRAVASQAAAAGISVGSFLARVDSSTGLLNALLGPLIGADLTLAGYSGIAAATVTLGQLRTQLGVGSVDQLLAADITLKNLLGVTADALSAKGDAVSLGARAGVVEIAAAADAALSLKLGDLVKVAAGDGSSAADVGINVLQLIQLAAQVANGDSAVSVGLSLASLGPLGSLLSPDGNVVELKVIEPPRIAIGPATQDASGNWVTSAHTAQLRLFIHLKPLGDVLGGLLDLPIYVEAAAGSAELRGITCATPKDDSTVRVHTETQAVRARIGTLSDINAADPTLSPAVVLNLLGLARVTARADVSVAGSANDLAFHGPFDWGNTQAVDSTGLGLGNLLSDDLQLDLELLGLPLGLGDVLGAVLTLLGPILAVVDNALLDPLLSLLGVSLGGGDVTNFSLDCSPLRLVS